MQLTRFVVRFLALTLTACLLTLIAPTAHATAFTVTNLNNSGAGSLRQALADAAVSPGSDTIDFGVTGTILLSSTLVVDSDVSIDGPGASSLTISGQNTVRVFLVSGGVTAAIKDLTIANGNADSSDGGGIYSYANLTVSNVVFNGNVAANGGGIYSPELVLNVFDSTFSGNTATQLAGGAILNYIGTVSITNSMFNGNYSARDGGAVSTGSSGNGWLKVINSTFNGNTAAFQGGGVYDKGVLTVTNSTFSNNAAPNGGGIQHVFSSAFSLNNSLMSNSRCQSTVSIGGSNNVATTGSGCPATHYSDLYIGTVADNGGATQTIALLPGSPAVNAGSNALAVDALGAVLTTDQRGAGFPRIANGTVDAGAYESALMPTPVISVTRSRQSVAEGNSTNFMFTRNNSAGALAVYFSMSGEAANGSDYTLDTPGSATFPDGVSSITVSLNALADGVPGELAEAVTLTLNADPAYIVGAQNAATLYIAGENTLVTNTNDDGEGSLRRALVNATAFNGTVTFDPAVFGTPHAILLGSTLLLDGSATIDGPGASLLTISGQDAVRVITVDLGVTATIQDVTIADGHIFGGSTLSNLGGGIRNVGNLTVMNVTFRNNSATDGGGAINNYGTLMVVNCLFEGNTTTQNGFGGAAIKNLSSGGTSATIEGSVFRWNTPFNSGTVDNQGGVMTLSNSTFDDNPGTDVVNFFGTLTLTNNTFRENASAAGAQALFINSGTTTLTNNTFYHEAASATGGITIQVINTAIVNVRNTLIAGPAGGSRCAIQGGTFTAINSLSTGAGCTGFTQVTLTDLHLGMLANNSGATQTIALLTGSAAIDVGDNAACPTLDQRGIARPLDGDGNGSAVCDVGAYEAVYVPPPTLISPFGVQETQPLSYSFNAVENAGWYYLWLSSDGGHVMDQWYSAVDICTGGICTITPSVSYSPQTYQWWVQAWGDSFGYTEWSNPLSFSFGTPNTPTQIAPIGVIDPASLSFRWSDEPGLTWYNIWIVSPDGSGQEFWYEDWAICTNDVCSAEPLNITGGIYTWWVRGWVNGQYTDWSPATYFQLPIGTAMLTAPSGTISMTQPSFSWSHVPSAYWYYLWVSNDATGYIMDQWYNTYNGICEFVGNTCTVTPALNLANGTYTFWVQAWSPIAGYGSWSTSQSFTVNVAPIVHEDVPVETLPPVGEVIPTETPVTEITPTEDALPESSTDGS